MSDGGKGSSPRPFSVSQEEFDKNYDAIFNKPKGTCGCGRSPTGNCCGWHSLSEDMYQKKLKEYKEKSNLL
jgi:hypothetical protein